VPRGESIEGKSDAVGGAVARVLGQARQGEDCKGSEAEGAEGGEDLKGRGRMLDW